MRRLAIIDLKAGQQPIYNEDSSIVVIFNGEIYNYRELREQLGKKGHHFRTESDTEVLVHLYEDFGENMVDYLRGMFAFAIWDAKSKRLFLARDRFGKKPLYYARTSDGGLLFASELKALRALVSSIGEDWEVDTQAIYDFLSLLVVPQPNTIFRGVRSLGAGCSLTFDGVHVQEREYWRLEFLPKTDLTYNQAFERARDLIGEAVRLRLRSDVPLGVFLSGGIDSSIIAYEASRVLGGDLQTFTVAMDDPAFDESGLAKGTAQSLGVRNTILPLRVSPLSTLQHLVQQYDQPFGDSSAIPSYEVSRLARQHVKVVLNGDGGDELFAGYRRYLAAAQAEKLRFIPAGLANQLASGLDRFSNGRRSGLGFCARFLRGVAADPGTRYLKWTTDMFCEGDKRAFWKAGSFRPTEQWIEEFPGQEYSLLDEQIHKDQRIILLSALLVKMDIATMAASLEARSPLMDHVLGEFAAKLPTSYLLRKGVTKSVLRDAYRRSLPDEVINGKKRGFEVPLKAWLTHELRPILWDTVGSKRARIRDYLDSEFVDQLLEARVMQDRNWAYLVYALLVLELWLEGIRDVDNQVAFSTTTFLQPSPN